MAKKKSHRKHRRLSSYRRSHRSLRGFLDPVVKGEVSSLQVLAGAAVGTVGAGLVKYALNQIQVEKKDAPGVKVGILAADGPLSMIAPVVPVLTASLAGAALYMVQKKSAMGKAHLVGAVSAGVAISAFDYLRTMDSTKKYFADYVSFPQVAGYNDYVRFPTMGVIANNPRLNGFGVIANNPRLAEVTASAMGAMGGDYDMMDAFTA